MKKLWRIWAKALGEKSGDTDSEADRVAAIRTLIVGASLVGAITGIPANIFIAINFYLVWIHPHLAK